MKRGSGHIEVIVSFVIFIAAVSFAFYFFNPGNPERVVESSLDYTISSVMKEVSSAVEMYSVKLNKEGIIGIDLEISVGKGVYAQNAKGERVNSSFHNGAVYLDWQGQGIAESATIIVSEELNNSVWTSYPVINENDYVLGSTREDKIASEKKILELNRSYYEDYLGLKKRFNLPNRANFGFIFAFPEGDKIVSESQRPEDSEIFSRGSKVPVLRNNGKISISEFTAEVW